MIVYTEVPKPIAPTYTTIGKPSAPSYQEVSKPAFSIDYLFQDGENYLFQDGVKFVFAAHSSDLYTEIVKPT